MRETSARSTNSSRTTTSNEQLPGLASGKAGVRQLFEMFHLAFDQARVEVDDMIAEGDKVFVLARMTGT